MNETMDRLPVFQAWKIVETTIQFPNLEKVVETTVQFSNLENVKN